jgi:hypothetical protein
MPGRTAHVVQLLDDEEHVAMDTTKRYAWVRHTCPGACMSGPRPHTSRRGGPQEANGPLCVCVSVTAWGTLPSVLRSQPSPGVYARRIVRAMPMLCVSAASCSCLSCPHGQLPNCRTSWRQGAGAATGRHVYMYAWPAPAQAPRMRTRGCAAPRAAVPIHGRAAGVCVCAIEQGG